MVSRGNTLELSRQKESCTEEDHLIPDPAHRMISIPPKFSVSQAIDYIKCSPGANVCGEKAKFCRPVFLA